MPFVSHPLIKENTIEQRAYQETILASVINKNSLVVLPTGLGKTYIAAMLVAHLLNKNPKAKILILAPTKPLVLQHKDTFSSVLKVDPKLLEIYTGSISPDIRKEGYDSNTIIFATPQVIENDIIAKRLDLHDISLSVLDEAHRATGNYSYVYIAEKYHETCPKGLILGITASPGHQRKQIKEIMQNIGTPHLHIEDEESETVAPYVHGVDAEWIKLKFPDELEKSRSLLKEVYEEKITLLLKMGLTTKPRQYIGKKDILAMGETLRGRLARQKDGSIYVAIKAQAGALKLAHAIELLETQGAESLCSYLDKMKGQKTKSSKELLLDPRVAKAYVLAIKQKDNSPKMDKLKDILSELSDGQNAIIFSQFRSTAQRITKMLKDIEGIRPIRFVGQAHKENDIGLSQKKQKLVLDQFREGTFNVLVATSVAEEGLDIPSVDLVIFFEPIPSEIRTIQRRGRTGRRRMGRVVVLSMKDTMDEAYYHVAKEKEKKMRKALKRIGTSTTATKTKVVKQPQKNLDQYVTSHNAILCDSRENPQMIKSLSNESDISVKMLEVGDYAIGGRIGIERKESSDFVRSLLDGRLFEQIKNLRNEYEIPILIIEGSPYETTHNVSENAIQNAILSLTVDFGISILFSKDMQQTVKMLVHLASRENKGTKKTPSLRKEKKTKSVQESQVFVLEGFPTISATLAKRLLKHFGTLYAVLSADIDELKKVEGIGEKKASAIHSVLNATYGD